MTEKLLIALLLALSGVPAGALPCLAASQGPPAVAVSIHPLADLLSRLAGDDFGVTALFGPGILPRKAPLPEEKLPPDLLLYVRVGDMFEGRSDRLAVASASRVVELSGGLELLGEGAEERAENRIFAAALGVDAGAAQGANPWFWLDPLRAAEAVDLMAAALAAVRPEKAEAVRERADRLQGELHELDREIASVLGPAGERTFAVFTASWSYFVRRYGLREVHLTAVVPGGGPGRHSLKGAAGKLREAGAARAFTDLSFPSSPAEAVAARAGVELLVLHPLGRKTAGGGGYFSLMREAAKAVAGGPP